jgi:DNA polymerase III epsilon subunit-like protein
MNKNEMNHIELSYKSYNTIPKQYIKENEDLERYILIFDTETTGLPKNNWVNFRINNSNSEMTTSEVDDFPYIVQLSFILYDNYENKIIVSNNEIIKIPENVEISEGSFNIHKISKESTQENSNRNIDIVLKDFMDAFYKSDIVVAHNISFDRNLILSELMRCYKETNCEDFKKYLKDFYYNKKEYCTCSFGSDECKIIKINKNGKQYYVKPKLFYLYNELFNGKNIDTNRLHDAFSDLLLCFRCFYKLRYNKDIYYMDDKIKLLIDDLTIKPVLRRSERLIYLQSK